MSARLARVGLVPALALATAAAAGILAAIQPTIAVVLVAGVIVALIVLGDIAAGFAALGLLSFLDTLTVSSSLSPSKGVGLLLAIAWLARFSVRRGERDFFSDHPLLAWMAGLFLVWMTVSLAWALDVKSGVSEIFRYVENVVLLPIAYTAVRSRRDLKLILGAIVLGAVIAALVGFVSPPTNPELISEGTARAVGTVGDPNELAAALVVGLGLAAGFAMARGESSRLRLAAALATPVCAVGIFVSLSRGGLIALGATLVAGVVLGGRWRPALAALLALIALGGGLYFADFASHAARERITTVSTGSGRTDLWTVGLRMVKDHPLNGVGIGNFQVASAKYVLQPGLLERTDLIFAEVPKVAHNTYLEVVTETGIPGLLLFLGVVGSCVACAWRAARLWSRRGAVNLEALARGMLLALVGMLVADFFITEVTSKLLWAMLAICPAMLALARREEDEVVPGASASAPAAPSRRAPTPAAPSRRAPTPTAPAPSFTAPASPAVAALAAPAFPARVQAPPRRPVPVRTRRRGTPPELRFRPGRARWRLDGREVGGAERVSRGAGFALASRLVGAACTAVLTIFLARSLSPAEYGHLSFALGVVALGGLFAEAGITASTDRFLAERREDLDGAGAVLSTAVRLKLALGLLVGAALWIAARPICDAFGVAGAVWPVRVLAVSLLAQSMFQTTLGAFASLGRLRPSLLVATLESVTELLASVALVLAGAAATGAAVGNAIGYVAGALFGLLLARRITRRRQAGRAAAKGAAGESSPVSARRILGYAGPLALVEAAFGLFASLDILLIAALLGGGVEVAAFALPMRLAVFLDYPDGAVATAIAPRLAARDRGERELALLSRGLRYMIALQMLIVAPLLIWPDAIVHLLFGDEYSQAPAVLRALAPYVLLSGVAQLATLAVNYLGAARRRVPLAFSMLAVNAAVDVVLLPRIGVVAAAIGTSAAYAVWVPGHLAILRRRIGLPIRPLLRTLVRACIATGAMVGVLAALGTGAVPVPLMALGAVIGPAVYLGVLVALRELGSADLAVLRGVLSRRPG